MTTLVDAPRTEKAAPAARTESVAELLERLGEISPARVRALAPASEDDVVRIEATEGRLFELVDGYLVEKPMGYVESWLAMEIGRLMGNYVVPRGLGLVSGPDGMMRLFTGRIVMPDVGFISLRRFPDGRVPQQPIAPMAPDLAVEVLSESNTKGEMKLKREAYFKAGTRLVWEIDPRSRVVSVYTTPTQFESKTLNDQLEGDEILPGFALSLKDLFETFDAIFAKR